MSAARFAWPSAILLSLCTFSDAWVLHRKIESTKQETNNVAAIELRRHEAQDLDLRKRQTTSLTCTNDMYEQLLDSNPATRIQTFCNEWLGLGPATTVVEYTPTITVTTSAESTTTAFQTTRILTTETVTQTATTTIGQPLVGRAANIAQLRAEVTDIMVSVLASGGSANATAEATATPTRNEQRVIAESGLANACSCKLVSPTSTVTSSYALPPAYSTVGYRVVVLVQSTETRRITVFTTVTQSLAVASTPIAMSTESGPALSDSAVVAPTNTPTEPTISVETSALPEQTTLPSGGIVPATNATTNNTVIAPPFSCPDAHGEQVDQVVGNMKLDYLIYCNTQITSEDRIGGPVSTDSETSCAARCSIANAQSGQSACQAAAFTPYTDGRSGGDCVLSTNNTEYASKPGSVAIVPIGMETNENDCAAFDQGVAPTPIDTSALAAAFTAGVTLTAPKLITQTENGGVSEFYISTNSTDAGGTVHWMYTKGYASSRYWQAVYADSYSCTRTIEQTVVQQPATPLPANSTTILETTIIHGATTTIIRGSYTQIIIGSGGIFGPSVVPASTTTGNGEITTFFSTATQSATGDSGIIPPTTGAVATPSLPIPSGNATTIVGSTAVTISGSTSTQNATGTGGEFPPGSSAPVPFVSTTTTTTTLGVSEVTISGSAMTSSATGGGGEFPPGNSTSIFVSSFATTVTVSGSNATTSGGGGGGEFPPTGGVVTVVETVSLGSPRVTISGSTATANATGSEGLIPPPSTATPVLNSTTSNAAPSSVASIVTSGGVSNVTVISSTATTNATGSEGLIPPPSTATPVLNSTTSNAAPSTVVSIVTSGGVSNVTVISSTATANSTGSEGVIPPPSTATPVLNSTTSNLAPSSAISIAISSGGSNVTISGSTLVSSAFGTGGIITPPVNASSAIPTPTGSTGSNSDQPRSPFPETSSSVSGSIVPPANSTVTAPPSLTPSVSLNITVYTSSGIEVISIANSTAVSSATGSAGIIPPVSSVSGVPPLVNVSSGVVTFSTATVISVGSSGVIPPASANSSSTTPPAITTKPGIEVVTLSGSTYTASFTGGTGVFPPANSTLSIRSTGTNSDAPRSPFPLPSSSVSGSIVPPANSTVTAPPSLTPSASLNITSLRSTGTNSDNPRSPFPLTSSSVSGSIVPPANSTVSSSSVSGSIVPPTNSTVTAPPSLTPSASLNITSLRSTGTNSDNPRSPFPLTSSSVSGSIVPPANSTVTAPPSLTPSASLNVTTSLRSTGTNSDNPRSPFPLTSSVASASIPPASANSTVPASSTPRSGIFTQITPSASVPVPSTNITTSLPVTETVVIPPTGGNFTVSSSVTVVSVTIPSASVNITVPVTLPPVNVTSVPSHTPSVSVNTTYTPPLVTGISSSVPSASPTPSLNSTIPSICPTAPLTVTETAISVSTQVVTATITQTVVGPIAGEGTSTLVDAASAASPSTAPEPAVPTPEAPAGAIFRARGEPATPAQRQAACDSTTNIVRNPDFQQGSDGSVPGWDVDSTDPNITVDSLANGNSTVAQFRSAAAGRELTVTQALTICPNQEYDIAASAEQATALADCNVTFTLVYQNGARVAILTIMPGEEWTRKNATFTATGSAEADMEIMAKCNGYKGSIVADAQGWMRVEVQGVSMVRDDE